MQANPDDWQIPEAFNDLKLELAKTYGEEDSKNKGYEFPDVDKRKKFNGKFDELKLQSFEIKHEVFKIDQETENQFAIAELLALEKFCVVK